MPSVGSIVVFALASTLALLLLRVWLAPWWRVRGVRRGALGLVAAGVLALGAWIGGIALHQADVARAGSRVYAAVIVFLLPTLVTLPLAGFVRRLPAWLPRTVRRRSDLEHVAELARGSDLEPTVMPPAPPALARRAVLESVAAALPVAAFAASGCGLAGAAALPRVHRIAIGSPLLPRALEGLRILHLSDLHLGAGGKRRRACARARATPRDA